MRREIRKHFQLHNNENVKICGIQLKQYLKVNVYVYDYISKKKFKKKTNNALDFPSVQWLTPVLPMQGARVQSLARQVDPTHHN